MGGVAVVQTKYRVTPTWVEVGLDWVRLGCRLGWVVTIWPLVLFSVKYLTLVASI